MDNENKELTEFQKVILRIFFLGIGIGAVVGCLVTILIRETIIWFTK